MQVLRQENSSPVQGEEKDLPSVPGKTEREDDENDTAHGEEQDLPSYPTTQPEIVMVERAKIHPDPNQPRRYFDEVELEKMAASMREVGIIDPLCVRPRPDSDEYDLLAGERRLRSAGLAGIESVPVRIFDVDERTAEDIKAISNLQRSDLNAWEETQAIMGMLMRNLGKSQAEVVSLLNQAANQKRGLTGNVVRKEDWEVVEEVFDLVGRLTPESFRKHRVPLLKLPEPIQKVLRQGLLQYTKVNEILKIKEEHQQQALLQEAIENNLSVEEIRSRVKNLRSKPADDTVPKLSERLTTVTRAIKQAKVWTDPDKQKQLEKLLNELENLLQ